MHMGTALGVGAGVQGGKDTEPPQCLVSLVLLVRKEQASSCETLELREGGKPWAGGGQLTLEASSPSTGLWGSFHLGVSDQEP